jgi:phosphatidylinositol alpha-1,6-mannosyltransferase
MLDNAGGMQRVSRQLIDALRKCDDVKVYTEAINVAKRGLVALQTAFFLLKNLLYLPRKVRRSEADVILFSSMVTASLAAFLQNRVDIPMVTINHGRDVTLETGIYQRFVPYVFKALDGVISVSRATRQESIMRGMPSEKGVALPNGFALESMDDLPSKESSRIALEKQFGLALEGKYMLLTVGRKVKRKGHEWFIREVLPKLPANVVYVTIGSGPERAHIEKAVRESNRKQQIYLLGRQPDIVLKQAYAAADLFIMPNIPVEGDMEGFGIVLLEANMAQTSVVASGLEGIRDVIASGKNGYTVPPLDADEFTGTINKMLQKDLEQLGCRAQRYVEDHFAWQHVSRDYIAYLAEVIQRYCRE